MFYYLNIFKLNTSRLKYIVPKTKDNYKNVIPVTVINFKHLSGLFLGTVT